MMHTIVQSPPASTSRTFSSSHIESLYPLITSHSPFPPTSASTILLSVSMYLTALGTSHKGNHAIFVLLGLLKKKNYIVQIYFTDYSDVVHTHMCKNRYRILCYRSIYSLDN